MKDDQAVPETRKREAFERIERLYESWGKPDKAAAWRAVARGRFAERDRHAVSVNSSVFGGADGARTRNLRKSWEKA